MCLLGPISGLRLLGFIRSSFRAGDFDILPSLKKRPTVRTEERQKLRQGSRSVGHPHPRFTVLYSKLVDT